MLPALIAAVLLLPGLVALAGLAATHPHHRGEGPP